MLERELKLFIPLDQQAAVVKAVQQLQDQHCIRLAAQYFDTAERDLAQNHTALRLRLEGDQWVQTLKMRGGDALTHLEYNHLRPEPVLDLSLYEHTPAAALFESLSSPLVLRYQTQVQRVLVNIEQGQSQIELALDLGHIQAQQSSLAISEIEFELKSGEMSAVFDVASQWLQRYGLILELRSKSERGDALYEYSQQHQTAVHQEKAGLALAQHPYRLPPLAMFSGHYSTELYTQGASAFLNQIIRNAAYLAGIDEIQAPAELQANYLTLMRVGMRRLRSCRQLYRPLLSASEKKLNKALAQQHSAFGVWRDKDMLGLELQPKLVAAGLPTATSAPILTEPTHTAQALASSTEFQLLLLHNLANLILHQSFNHKSTDAAHNHNLIAKRLQNWLVTIQKQSLSFDQMKTEAQHRLRNHIKRLRYSLEILGYDKTNSLYAALAKAQDQLGHLCDAYVAQDWYQSQATSPAQQQFALHWLQDKIQKNHTKSKKALLLLHEQSLIVF